MPWCDLRCIDHMLGWLCPSLQGACNPKEQSLSDLARRPAALLSYEPLAEETAAPFAFIFLSYREKWGQKVPGPLNTVAYICTERHGPSTGANPPQLRPQLSRLLYLSRTIHSAGISYSVRIIN